MTTTTHAERSAAIVADHPYLAGDPRRSMNIPGTGTKLGQHPQQYLRGGQCLCSRCGFVFSSESTFAAHRVGESGLDRRCLSADELHAMGWGIGLRGWSSHPVWAKRQQSAASLASANEARALKRAGRAAAPVAYATA